uniref:Gamma-butyrobetaine dioxygenase-like n=1 Tax=Phallusia mammillata TaxID=59560 RepID=A0A6F9D824_9ASCI|nr:gamma-butyrobetaine dioxygenase-like [Phallusia mammillata]
MATIQTIQVGLDKDTCEVLWKDGHTGRFHAKWLRFNCRCEQCVSPIPGVYTINIPLFPDDLSLISASVDCEGKKLQTEYKGEILPEHKTVHPANWLRSKCYCDACLDSKIAKRDVISRYVTSNDGERNVRKMQYKTLLDDEDIGLYRLLKDVVEAGVCLIQNVPTEERKVVEIAKKIAYIEPTSYGKMYDIYVRDSENVAYTNLMLPLHQDQVSSEIAPGIQLLHTMRFDKSVTGGESIIVDMFEAVEVLRVESPEDFRTLVEVPGCWLTEDPSAGRYFEHHKCHIQLDYFGKVAAVNWNATTFSTPQVRDKDVNRYYKAYTTLSNITRRKSMQYCFKLEPGDLIVFNNRRMAHARKGYELNGGTRHLQGTYIKLDDMKSKYLALCRKLEKNVVPPKIGNNCSF